MHTWKNRFCAADQALHFQFQEDSVLAAVSFGTEVSISVKNINVILLAIAETYNNMHYPLLLL